MTKGPRSFSQEAELLTPTQLKVLSERIKGNADLLIELHRLSKCELTTSNVTPATAIQANPGQGRGRPAKCIINPFCGLIGPTTGYGRYPYFAQEIIEGIARLDWHGRPISKGGSSKPLSVRHLMDILANLEEITTDAVSAITRTKQRQSQRYVKAIELAMPYLMRARPSRLVYQMGMPEDELANAVYRNRLREAHLDLQDDLPPPRQEELAKLRQDLGEDAFDLGRLINAAYSKQKTPIDHHLHSGSFPSIAA